ncbi:dynein heavy chain 9, axonemal-like [Sinocyclocheilus rhinocerous]|uniref:dynein heavy chain 9, axonemal-like n=1 Tax=Sinocyclocheilus rhinocerous TaxID=307959 RepID=UPI0007BA1486|nr:PREDICTED: dynein heavy chain 9, axonemal-like [Sinocyclocheilus rhinocerous]
MNKTSKYDLANERRYNYTKSFWSRSSSDLLISHDCVLSWTVLIIMPDVTRQSRSSAPLGEWPQRFTLKQESYQKAHLCTEIVLASDERWNVDDLKEVALKLKNKSAGKLIQAVGVERSRSIACPCSWVINIVKFYEVYCEVEPKRQALSKAKAELASAQEKLSGIKAKINIGDKECEYKPSFRLTLHTKLMDPHSQPELQAQCAVVSLETGPEELIISHHALTNRAVNHLSSNLTKQQNGSRITLKTLEDNLLSRLSSASRNFLGDIELVENLEITKRTAAEIEVKDTLEMCAGENEFKSILFALCYTRGGGWNRSHPFNILYNCLEANSEVKAVCDEILEKLPEEFNMTEIMGKVEERRLYIVVAFQECEHMNILTQKIKRSLKELNLGLKSVIAFLAHLLE